MSDKKPQWGRKAQPGEQPDPNEYVFGKHSDDQSTQGEQSTSAKIESNGGQENKPRTSEPERMIRITVDVKKSLHRQLQRVCNAQEVKLAQFIRQLLERELKKTKYNE